MPEDHDNEKIEIGNALSSDHDQASGFAQLLLRQLDMAEELFPEMGMLSSSPAWRMAIELFVAANQDREVTADQLCRIVGGWEPLSMRFIDVLCQQGAFVREYGRNCSTSPSLRLSESFFARLAQTLCDFPAEWLKRVAAG